MFNSHQLHRFAIRKYAVGVCSVMVASLLFLGTSRVSADQLEVTADPRTEQVADSLDQLQDQELKVEPAEIAVVADIATPLPAVESVVVEPVAESLPTPVVELISETTVVPKTEESPESATLQTAPIASKSQELTQEIKSAETQPTLTANQVVQNQQSPDGEGVSALKPELDSQMELKQEKSLEQVTETKDGLDSQNIPTEPAVESPARPVKAAPTKFTLGTGFRSFGMTRSATPTGVIGDDYPAKWKHLDPDSHIDDWGMYVRYCTSFVAHRLSSANKFELPRAYGNAEAWGGRARSEGYRVDNTPVRGAVAWSDASAENEWWGHVAWVAAVNGDMVTVEEYNYGNRNAYNSRTVHKSAFTGYIHFKDLGHRAVATPPTVTNPHGLPAQGTYTFTQRAGVKNEPKQSSPNRDFYEVGEKVNYDKVLESDNHVWLSYINYAGSRSYVAIKVLTPANPTPTPAPTIPSQGTYRFTKTLPIKNQASMASATIDHYYAGETVNYDRVLTAEGRQWISYMSHSGLRRYIPLN